jgi:leucyl aminopeptidase
MNVNSTDARVAEIDADAVVVGIELEKNLTKEARELDEATGGILTRLAQRGELSGKVGDVATVLSPPGVRAGLVAVVGLGSPAEFGRGEAFKTAAAAAKKLAEKRRRRVAFFLGAGWTEQQVESGICGSMVGCCGQDLYRSEKDTHPFDEILWDDDYEVVLSTGRILGETVNLTRQLVNEPPSRIYPESFAAEAAKFAEECGLDIEVWDERRLDQERCGALLAVGRGSARPPRLVVLRHSGGETADPLLALVGKGVTFDSGGLSLKTGDSMKTMKCDMAGAATVLGAMQAIARLELPINVIGLAGLVENLPGGESYKVGDVVTTRSGKTVEVLNTDAEGRLVLADVLDVAVERGAEKLIDLATLTGACVVALGNDVAGLMSNHQAWCDIVKSAADACGEPAWQLPMFAAYAQEIRSKVADLKNVGEGRWGGAITAAKFLEEFVRGKPWVHIDIAGPAFLENAKPWADAGGTGALVRTLVEIARGWPPAIEPSTPAE